MPYPPKSFLTMATPQRFPTSVCGPATVYGERMSMDKRAFFGVGKKRDRKRNILRRCEAPHRYAASNVRVGVSPACLVGRIHLGLDPAGANCIYAYTSSAPFCG